MVVRLRCVQKRLPLTYGSTLSMQSHQFSRNENNDNEQTFCPCFLQVLSNYSDNSQEYLLAPCFPWANSLTYLSKHHFGGMIKVTTNLHLISSPDRSTFYARIVVYSRPLSFHHPLFWWPVSEGLLRSKDRANLKDPRPWRWQSWEANTNKKQTCKGRVVVGLGQPLSTSCKGGLV